MLLGGLWHGAAWTFVVWGAIHGAARVEHWRRDRRWRSSAARQRRIWVRRIVTFHIVCLALDLLPRRVVLDGLGVIARPLHGVGWPRRSSRRRRARDRRRDRQRSTCPGADRSSVHGALLAAARVGQVVLLGRRARWSSMPWARRASPPSSTSASSAWTRRPAPAPHAAPGAAATTACRAGRSPGRMAPAAGPVQLHPAGQAIVVGIGVLVLAAFLSRPAGTRRPSRSTPGGSERRAAARRESRDGQPLHRSRPADAA